MKHVYGNAALKLRKRRNHYGGGIYKLDKMQIAIALPKNRNKFRSTAWYLKKTFERGPAAKVKENAKAF